jgi:putative ABC transport system substrate-binding protein
MLFALCPSAEAQQPAKVPRIGYLGAGPGTLSAPGRLFWREFSKLGYVEGKNITIEYRYADNKLDRLPALAEELVRLKVELLVTPGVNAALAAKNATKTIPIVIFNVSDPVADGLVDNLARPGGNITGFANIFRMLGGKRLELLKETIPKLARVAVLWDPKNRGSAEHWKENPLLSSRRKQVIDLAAKNRLPAIYHQGDFVEGGGLMSYGSDQVDPYVRVASMVDKILNGTKPADIPVEQPRKFEFIINLKTAKQIGLTIPPNVLVRADRVIR